MSEYTVKQLSSMFDVSESTISRVLRNGKIRYYTKGSKQMYFGTDALAFLKRKFKKIIQIVEVPKYYPIYYEIYQSKINNQ